MSRFQNSDKPVVPVSNHKLTSCAVRAQAGWFTVLNVKNSFLQVDMGCTLKRLGCLAVFCCNDPRS